MILIISEKLDVTTDRVIDWLNSFGYTNIIRINEGEPIFVEQITLSNQNVQGNILLKHNEHLFTISEVCFFWYRREKFSFEPDLQITEKMRGLNEKLNLFTKLEWLALKKYLITKLEQKPHLGEFYLTNTNKLINLEAALSCG